MVQDIPLAGPPGRFDYQDVDDAGRRLYVADLGGSRIDVFDLDALRPLGAADGVPDAHGVRLAPDLTTVFATATAQNQLVAVDTATLQVVRRTSTGHFPDGLAYDPQRHLVAVSNRDSGTVTVVDAGSGAVRRTVPVNSHVGNVIYDPVSKAMLVAGVPPDRLVSFDPATGTITERIKLPGCHGAHGVAVEPSGRLAFVGCEKNDKLSIVDLKNHRQLGLRPTGKTPDVLAIDAGLDRLYVAAEDGVVCVFDVTGDAVRRIGQGLVAPGAHSVAVDPRTHRVLFPLENLLGHPALRVMRP
jgi:DNA-binding beta-propeller fold protein YncE